MEDFFLKEELETKFGIDKTMLMLKFMKIIQGSKPAHDYSSFKLWLKIEMKRRLSKTEDLKLCEAILNFVQSEPGSNERFLSISYIIDMRFIQD